MQTSFKPDIVEYLGERVVWTFLFDGLSPYTMYTVTAATSLHTITTSYRTMPMLGSTTVIKVGMGGDVALTTLGRQIFDLMGT